jgi:transposase
VVRRNHPDRIKEIHMPTYSIDTDDNLAVHPDKDAAIQEAGAAGAAFATEAQLNETTASSPTSRMVQVWNSFAGAPPFADLKEVKKFTDHKTAAALIAAIGNGAAFRKGREFAAWLGLVPREHSTGGRQKLLGISKRGNTYLWKLFVQCAHAVLQQSSRQSAGLRGGTLRLPSGLRNHGQRSPRRLRSRTLPARQVGTGQGEAPSATTASVSRLSRISLVSFKIQSIS